MPEKLVSIVALPAGTIIASYMTAIYESTLKIKFIENDGSNR